MFQQVRVVMLVLEQTKAQISVHPISIVRLILKISEIASVNMGVFSRVSLTGLLQRNNRWETVFSFMQEGMDFLLCTW